MYYKSTPHDKYQGKHNFVTFSYEIVVQGGDDITFEVTAFYDEDDTRDYPEWIDFCWEENILLHDSDVEDEFPGHADDAYDREVKKALHAMRRK